MENLKQELSKILIQFELKQIGSIEANIKICDLFLNRYEVIKNIYSIPFQKCPICNGECRVPSLGYTSSCYDTCSVCKGNKIILMGRQKNQSR